MKKISFAVLLLAVVLGARDLCAEPVKDLARSYGIVSVLYPVPDKGQKNFPDVYFKFAWNDKAPFVIAVQLVNRSYASRKIKFAIKDVTSKKMVVLDKVRNARFGSETLKPNSKGAIWSGGVDDIKGRFLLRVWNSEGEEFNTEPISISDQQ